MTAPPPTRREVVSETLHGVTIDDPYRWLEDGESADVQQWVAAQNRHTREALDARPDAIRRGWHERLVALMGLPVVLSAVLRPTADGPTVFALERRPGADQYVLTTRRFDGLHREPNVLFDPAAFAGDPTNAIDWFEPSPSATLIAVGTSVGGTENSTLRVLDVQATLARLTPTFLADVIPNTRACSLAWEHDAAGFLYTRYPEGDEYHRTVHSHRLGDDPADDPVVWAEHETPQTWPSIDLSIDGRWAIVHAMVGWGRDDVYLLDRRATEAVWVPVVVGQEAASHFVFDGDALIGTTTVDAPMGRVVRAPLDTPGEWSTIVAERDVVLGRPEVCGEHVLVVASTRAVDRLERWTRSGELNDTVDLGLVSIGSVSAIAATGPALAVVAGFDAPNRMVAVTSTSPEVAPNSEGVPALAVEQLTFESTDGTPIGMFLIHRPDAVPDGDRPVILTGYGGFAISMAPAWSATIAAWCEQGGVYAIAGLRGGTEQGEAWHEAGRRGNKQNVFDDFHAAADFLVDSGRASRDRLAIDGRSNGGLLVGVALTQRPDLCAAVSCGVPLLDMIRFPHFRIARLWTDEYGDPDIEEEFAWLHAYSPYHHVVDDGEYPATFIWTAEGDTRVDPLHARKMTARLQAATDGSDRPILLQQEGRAGHGVGKPASRRAAEQADVLTFFSWQLGIE